MPVYTEYLNMGLGPKDLGAERKKQLARISQIRGRDVLVYAASLRIIPGPQAALTSINYEDLISVEDQLSGLTGQALDLIVESPGGSGEVAEDIVRLIRAKYNDFAVIVPGWAKSAATLIAMAAGELLMGRLSALGPIDAQLQWQGKVFSADALLEGMEKIKQEVTASGFLNKAYIPMLQNISPGELQSADNALNFAKRLVTAWLAEYKFAAWHIHSSTGEPVSPEDRKERAAAIADTLCNHKKWLVHGRSIKISDLRDMRLLVTDYSEIPELDDAIGRYHTLLQMTFDLNIYKLFETPTSEIAKILLLQGGVQTPAPPAGSVIIDVRCDKCGTNSKVQANINGSQPLQPGALPFPASLKLRCPNCKHEIDLGSVKQQIEQQFGKIVT
jgi:ribosomal protein S27E